ncbi:MAG: type II secretion system minor pseudopilin GspI [Pseudomonadota bacterium]
MTASVRQSGSERGFTLVEVLVALVVAAVGISAVAVAMSQHADNTRRLRDATLAAFIAGNTLTILRMSADAPDVGRTTEEVEYAQRDWLVTTVIQESGIPSLLRADVSVADARKPDRTLRTINGFLAEAAPLPVNARPSFSALPN